MTHPAYPSSGLKAFPIPDGHEANSWGAIADSCKNLSEWSIKTLRSGLNGIVKTVILEPHYICKDYRNLFSNFYSKKFVQRSGSCSRLLFFSKPDVTVRDAVFDAESLQEAFIGYSVVQPVRDRSIGQR